MLKRPNGVLEARRCRAPCLVQEIGDPTQGRDMLAHSDEGDHGIRRMATS